MADCTSHAPRPTSTVASDASPQVTHVEQLERVQRLVSELQARLDAAVTRQAQLQTELQQLAVQRDGWWAAAAAVATAGTDSPTSAGKKQLKAVLPAVGEAGEMAGGEGMRQHQQVEGEGEGGGGDVWGEQAARAVCRLLACKLDAARGRLDAAKAQEAADSR
jgi:hypothetical protein